MKHTSSGIAMPEIRALRKADEKHVNWALAGVIAAAALAGGRRGGKALLHFSVGKAESEHP